MEPLRFLHAAGARIDHQLHDLDALPDDLRPIVEVATTTAFERMIAAALEHAVDFVLLTGNTFDAADRSLRARVVLLSGLRQLAEFDIPVFIVPGDADPAEAWQTISDLPENVTVFPDATAQPADFWRSDACLATISVARTLGTADRGLLVQRSTTDTADPEPVARDYFALGGCGPRRTLTVAGGIAHHPGAFQAIRAHDVGPHGCTLIEFSDDEIRRTFLPLAPVRREQFAVEVDTGTSRDELRGRMDNLLAACAPEAGEEVWLVDWKLTGSGPLIDQLADEAHCRPLADELDWDAGREHGVRIHHSIEAYDSGVPASLLSRSGSLRDEFFERLAAQPARVALDQSPLAEPAWTQCVAAAVAELDREAVLSHSRRLGAAWFDAPLEGPAK